MRSPSDTSLLDGVKVVSLAVNLPGPVAASRLANWGATVVKVEPPAGDPLRQFSRPWYEALVRNQKVVTLNLKDPDGRATLDGYLAESDLLLTSSRPAALERLGLDWPRLHHRFARLNQVAIVGYPAPAENRAGHDLTYQASLGLVQAPHLPRTLMADLATAERAVSTGLALLIARDRGVEGRHEQVSLVEATAPFADPLRYGLTAAGGLLGGGSPGYNIYPAQDGWVALAALEPHFWQRLEQALGETALESARLTEIFRSRTALEWERWADERDLPIVALRGEGLSGVC